jgi:NADP-dependent 3-hydroxy acid dehydrogenase YdfG
MKTIKFQCDDRYEAEKLAGLVSVQKDETAYVAGVAAVIGNEIVIKLKDKSSHAVLLKDRENVDRLKSLLTDVMKGKIKIRSSDFAGSVTEITLD